MKDRHISGESYRALRDQQDARGRHTIAIWLVPLAVVLLLTVGALVWSERQHHNTASSSGDAASAGTGALTTGGGNGGAQQSTGGLNANKGTVTAISQTSITVQFSSGDTKTYSISGNTSISDAGSEVYGSPSAQLSPSDIHAGDTVAILPDNSSATLAAGILINPR